MRPIYAFNFTILVMAVTGFSALAAGPMAPGITPPWPPGCKENGSCPTPTSLPEAAARAPSASSGEQNPSDPKKYAEQQSPKPAENTKPQDLSAQQMPPGTGGNNPMSTGADGAGPLGALQTSMETCDGNQRPDATAMQTALDCAKRANVNGNMLALVDGDRKLMHIIDRNDTSFAAKPVKCVRISTGRNGFGTSYGQSPRGLMITGPHAGNYNSNADGQRNDCVGLKGTDPETRTRESNGVIMHPAHGGAGSNSTLGCIGVEDKFWSDVKKTLYGPEHKQSAVFIFTKETREKCSAGQGSGDRVPAASGGGNTGANR